MARNAGTICPTASTRRATGTRRHSRWAARARATMASSSEELVYAISRSGASVAGLISV